MSDEIRKVIASALQDARHEGQRVRFSDEYAGAMTEAALNALHAAGYEVVKKRCKHAGYRGPVRDGRKCPDCGGRAFELAAKI